MHLFINCSSTSFYRVSALFIAVFLITLHLLATPSLSAQVSLSWSPPTTHTDGTPITNLGGHKIHIGTAPGSYSQKIDVGNSTNYTLSSLNDATPYYFAVTAYDTAGVESGFSNPVSHTTPAPPPAASLYTLSAAAGSGGSITPSGSVVVSKGISQKFAITPSTGYKIAGVTVDGASVGAVSTYTFSNVAANHTIAATFAPNTISSFTITANAGTGGTISPYGTSTITSGGSKAFTFTPNTGYKVADVKADGVSVGAIGSYTFSNITANHTIQASFAAITTTSTTKVVYAINCGGPAFTDSKGISYRADTAYSGGTAFKTTTAVAGTNDDALYQSSRYGTFSYNIPVTNGSYLVTLKLSEPAVTGTGHRIFDVKMENVEVLTNLDIYAKAGKNSAYDVIVPVNVTDSLLSINFINNWGNATVSGIVVTAK